MENYNSERVYAAMPHKDEIKICTASENPPDHAVENPYFSAADSSLYNNELVDRILESYSRNSSVS